MIAFDMMWQPIVLISDPPALPYHRIAAATLRIQPPGGQDLETWWEDRLREGTADDAQGQLECRLTPYLPEMQRARQWHVPLHPQVPPATRDWLPFWNEDGIKLNLVYELPVDRPIDDWVWAEIELVRRAPNAGRPPLVAGTHVGRQGLATAATEALNDGPFQVLLLDAGVTRGLTNRFDPRDDDSEVWRRFLALSAFLQHLRPDLPIVATGIQTDDEVRALAALGVKYAQGSWWCPPTPLEETFRNRTLSADPDWFPDKAYPDAQTWALTHRLTFEPDGGVA